MIHTGTISLPLVYLNKKSPALSVCVCVYLERSAACPSTPSGRARRACPEGAPKGPRRGHCGRRPPGGAEGGEGGHPPKKNFIKTFFSPKNFPEGRQGVLEGGGKEMGFTPPNPPNKFSLPKIFSPKNLPKGPQRSQAAREC